MHMWSSNHLRFFLFSIIALLSPSSLLATDVEPRLEGSWPGFPRGYATDLAIAGNYAYVTAGSVLHIIDISTPASPRRIGGYDANSEGNTVAVLDSYAYVG